MFAYLHRVPFAQTRQTQLTHIEQGRMTWSDTERATNNDYMSQEMAEHGRLKLAATAEKEDEDEDENKDEEEDEDEDAPEIPDALKKAEQKTAAEEETQAAEDEDEEEEEEEEKAKEEEEVEEEDEQEENDMVVDLSVIQDGLKMPQREARTQEAQGSDSDMEEVAEERKDERKDENKANAEQKPEKKKRKQSDGVEEKISSPNGGASKKARKPEKRRVCNMCNRELGMQTWRRHQSCYQKSQNRSEGEPRKRHQCSKCQAVVAGCTALHSSHKCGEEQWDQETKTYMKISKVPHKKVQQLDDDATESDESSDDKPQPAQKASKPKVPIPPKALVPKAPMAVVAAAAPQIRMVDVNGTKRDQILADFIRALKGREGYVLVIPPM